MRKSADFLARSLDIPRRVPLMNHGRPLAFIMRGAPMTRPLFLRATYFVATILRVNERLVHREFIIRAAG